MLADGCRLQESLDDHCRSVHCFGVHSRKPAPVLGTPPAGTIVMRLEPVDDTPATQAAIARSRHRARSTATSSTWREAVEEDAPASVAVAPLLPAQKPIRPHPIYLRVQEQLFAELWALFSTGVCLTTTFKFAPELTQEQVLVPSYSDQAHVIWYSACHAVLAMQCLPCSACHAVLAMQCLPQPPPSLSLASPQLSSTKYQGASAARRNYAAPRPGSKPSSWPASWCCKTQLRTAIREQAPFRS